MTDMKTTIVSNSRLAGLIVCLLTAFGIRAQSCLTWVQRTDVGSPGQRAHHAMAYDSDRGVTVFFGGQIGKSGEETYFDDTWEYDGTHWTQITINGSKPSARSSHSMAYDPVHHQVVMLGGQDSGGLKGDTWIYQGNGTTGTWTLATAETHKSAEGGMVWDSQDSQILMLILEESAGFINDLRRYLWNGSSYTYTGKSITRHYVYFRAGMAFDPALGKAISAGGYGADNASGNNPFVLDETYAFGPGGDPTQLVSLPSGREYPMMAYDSRRKKMVIVGGDNGQSGTGESVYEYDSTQPTLGWQTGVALPSGSGRAGGAMVYDEKRGVMVLMGGAGAGAPNGNDGGRYSDTWELTPTPLSATVFPPNTTACKGEPLTLTLFTGDTRMFKFQWYVGSVPTAIAGATNAVLNIPDNEALGTVRYTVTMQDDCGNPFTRFVDITTHQKPVLSDYSIQGEAIQCPGGAIQFTVVYFSDPPATLQWYRDSTLLAGQTAAAISLANLQKGDSGHYHLVLSNSCGTVDTLGWFTFPLQVGPAITAQPVSVTATPCDGADFTVTAVGVGSLRYQWRMEGVPLTDGGYFSGTTSDHLHIEPLVYSLERSFDVVVTDDCGPENAATSAPASLQLPTPPWLEVAMSPAPPTQPSPSGAWVSAYDENRRVLVLYGGIDRNGAPANSLWEYDGTTWRGIQDAYPGPVTTNGQMLPLDNQSPPTDFAAVYNPDDHLVYLFGVYGGGTPLIIWTWNGTHWNRPYYGPMTGAEHSYRAVYDRSQHRILLTRSHEGSYQSELLIYDPVSNLVSPPLVMQPPLEAGRVRAFWVYDEYRQLELWYQNDGVGFGPATMWARDPSMSWIKLSGKPTLPNYGDRNVTYDPIRRRTVSLGSTAAYPYDTATRVFPGTGAALPSATDWLTELPDGPPRNPTGLGHSPTNTFFPETLAFDRRRRARVAPGFLVPPSGPPSWTTYESRYQDAVVFDAPVRVAKPTIGGTLSLKAYAAGYGTLGYKWRHNGTEIADGAAGASPNGGLVSGAKGSILVITGVASSDLGNYEVVVSNKCGPLTSVSVTVSPAGAVTISPPVIANGNLTIQFDAEPGAVLTIEAAATVTGPWIKVMNETASASGRIEFKQVLPEGKTQFYRTVSPAY
jgi:hypothetical protein